MSGQSILIVEDETEISQMLHFLLGQAGFDTSIADTAELAFQKLDGPLPNLLLVDWMLPGMSGMEFIRRLRGDPLTRDVPVIMLTAKGEEQDKLKGLDTGADDYVTKPFSPKELISRIKALLRRSSEYEEGRVNMGGLCLDAQSHRVFSGEQELSMGPTEYRLLEFFMNHPDRAYSREQLLDRVWGRATYIEERTVDVHIRRLRKCLEPFGHDALIQTVRGAGYRFSGK